MNAVSKHFLKRFLKKMGCGMVLAGCIPSCFINKKRCFVALLYASLNNLSYMADPSTGKFDRFTYFKLTASGPDDTGISFLSAHCGIEGS